jgi:hypothetical protein
MSHEEQNLKNVNHQSKAGGTGNDVNPVNTDQDVEASEVGKPLINKKIPKNVPGIDTGRWAD